VDQILRDAGGEITLINYDATGAAADVNGTEAPTIAVVDSAGVSVSGFTPSRTGTGSYKATLPANLETLDIYDVMWSWTNDQSRRSQVEVVGGFLFTVAELRSWDPVLADATKYPSTTIKDHRAAVTERFESIAGLSFVRRGARAMLDGRGSGSLVLPHVEVSTARSIKVDGTALSGGDLANVKVYPHGQLVWDGGTFAKGLRNVEVLYEHGLASVPRSIARAAMRYARYLLAPSPFESERATAVFTEAGGYRLTIAGRDGETGLPEVDAVLADYRRAQAGFA
jgi:hypothetical protein